MKQGLSLRVSQHLALTPQLQQSIRLLQLSTLELSQEVEQMLDDNPFLEVADDGPTVDDFNSAPADTRTATTSSEDGESTESYSVADDGPAVDTPDVDVGLQDNWEGDGSVEVSPDDSEWGGDAPGTRKADGDDDTMDAVELARNQESMTAFLHRQALALRLDAVERAALYFLIESLNDDGYLDEPLAVLAAAVAGGREEEIEELIQRFEVALRLLQSLEPVGIGARDLAECLTLQLRALESDDVVKCALEICRQPIELLARRDIKRLVQLCHDTEPRIRRAIALIQQLEPKPGRRFIDVERNVVVPDVIVLRSGRGAAVRFRVQLNPDVMPKLRVHDVYAGALKASKGGSQALQQRLQEARWFIKNIQQRFDTILRVSSAIVERQKNFFVHGELAMRPLVLREIADELGLHESTISRVTTAKYMATPYGTFELKYFFGSALGTETGGNASSTAVRALIKQFVSAESTKKPLSDNQISEMLREQGIECARRTVAKYREALRIAPANLRKAL